MSTNINFNKKLGITGDSGITLATNSTPSFSNVNSFSFDGVDEIFEGSSIYSELNGGTKLTLSIWLKPISGSPFLEYIVSNPRDASANNSQFALTLYEGFSVSFNVQSRISQYVSGRIGAITYGAWNHILVCVDLDRTVGTEGAIFINGRDETTTSRMGTLSSFYTATDALHIGVDANGGYNRYNGNIDELAIWSGQDFRGASEVSAIYNSGVPSNLNNTSGIAQPSLYFRMGENATFGTQWTMTDVNASYSVTSANMLEANRTTDVPTASSFTNTKSILLDGVDDFVTMGNVLDTSNTGADELSISAWYKTTTNATQLIVAKWANQSPFNGYALFLVGKELRFFIGSFVGNAYINVKSNSINSLIDGNWHHVVLTYDGSRASSGVKIYVDSTEISLNIIRDVAPDGVSDYSSYQDFMIGVRGNASNIGLPFDGNIDEVSYFNSELSASDVTSIYNSGVPNDISSLSPVSWWRCGDGDTAPILTDNGSASNDGTMTNFTTFSTDVPT
jgi:hypothetical protein